MATDIRDHPHTFEFIGGALALDFANTLGGYDLEGRPSRDYVQDYNTLTSFVRQAGTLGQEEETKLHGLAAQHPHRAESVMERARALRWAIHQVFASTSVGAQPDRALLHTISQEAGEALAHAHLEPEQNRPGEDQERTISYSWAWNDLGRELEGPLWLIAKSAADLLLSQRLERVRVCGGDTCGWLFIDTSKNRSRRWCDMRECGNTAKARRHYQRKKAQARAEGA